MSSLCLVQHQMVSRSEKYALYRSLNYQVFCYRKYEGIIERNRSWKASVLPQVLTGSPPILSRNGKGSKSMPTLSSPVPSAKNREKKVQLPYDMGRWERSNNLQYMEPNRWWKEEARQAHRHIHEPCQTKDKFSVQSLQKLSARVQNESEPFDQIVTDLKFLLETVTTTNLMKWWEIA